MTTFFKGEAVILYIKKSAVYVPIVCLTSNSLSETFQILGTIGQANNGWTSAMAGKRSSTISFSGVVSDIGGTDAGLDYLKEVKRNRTLIEWKMENPLEVITTEEGTGYITSLSESAPASGNLEFNGTITVSGEFL